jgi:hypothetical protein
MEDGEVAKWQGSGLQSRDPWFDPRPRLAARPAGGWEPAALGQDDPGEAEYSDARRDGSPPPASPAHY